MPANSSKRRASFGRRTFSSIIIEFVAGFVVFLASIPLHGIGHQVTDWVCFVVGVCLILHAVASLLAKVLRRFGGGTAMMAIMAIACLVAVLTSSALADPSPEKQGGDGRGGYMVYPVDQNGCRTIMGWSTGTYPQLVISLNPFKISFSGVDYIWPVTVTYCSETVTSYASDNSVISSQQILYALRVNKDLGWQRVDGTEVEDYTVTGAKAVWNANKTCVNIRVHAWVKLKIPPPAIPRWILPASFVTKPWIEFDNLCNNLSYGEIRHDPEPA